VRCPDDEELAAPNAVFLTGARTEDRVLSYDRLEDWARPVAAATAALFIGDLFLSWQRTAVHVADAVQVHHIGLSGGSLSRPATSSYRGSPPRRR
jgi:hypothetical protein